MSDVLSDLIRATGELSAALRRHGIEPDCGIVFDKAEDLFNLSAALHKSMATFAEPPYAPGEFKLNGIPFRYRRKPPN